LGWQGQFLCTQRRAKEVNKTVVPNCLSSDEIYLVGASAHCGFSQRALQGVKRGKAPGVGGVTVKEYEANLEENLKDLVERLRAKRYRPQPVRRVYIPKSKGGKMYLLAFVLIETAIKP